MESTVVTGHMRGEIGLNVMYLLPGATREIMVIWLLRKLVVKEKPLVAREETSLLLGKKPLVARGNKRKLM